MDGCNRCTSSFECATSGPDCKRLAVDGVVVADFLYGDEFCGLIVTAGADEKQN